MSLTSSSHFLRCLSVWIGFVALMAIGNTLQCFIDHSFMGSRLYTKQPDQNVTGLAARLFGVWTLLASVLRFACALDIHNKTVYNLTYISFFLALGHFASEIYPYQSAELSVGVLAPLLVSSLSIVLMTVGYWFPRNTKGTDKKDSKQMSKKAKLS